MSKYISIINNAKHSVSFHFNCDKKIATELKNASFTDLKINEKGDEAFVSIPPKAIINVLDGKLTQQFLSIQNKVLEVVTLASQSVENKSLQEENKKLAEENTKLQARIKELEKDKEEPKKA